MSGVLAYQGSGVFFEEDGWEKGALDLMHEFLACDCCDGRGHVICGVVHAPGDHDCGTVLSAAARRGLSCGRNGWYVAWGRHFSRKRIAPGDGWSIVVSVVLYV